VRILNGGGYRVSSGAAPLSDSVHAAILEEASNWGADLIVLGSRGLRGMDRVQLGSVSEAVALHANCSVEVIRVAGS
jgi:nucleotide-binding universal stress UspA family protein